MKTLKRKSNRIIVGGLAFLVILAIIVFAGMNRYMDGKTESDVRTIGQTYVRDFAQEELYHFTSISSIRYLQGSFIAKEATDGKLSSADSAQEIVSKYADFQELVSCYLISSTGQLEKVYGEEITGIYDQDSLISNLSSGQNFVTSGTDPDMSIIIWGIPAQISMQNNETSIGILCCRPISKFIDMLHLSADNTMAYFHVIRKDGEYVVKNDDAHGDTFFDKIRDYATPYGMTSEECVEGLKNAIANGETYEYAKSYYLEATGESENRCVYALPLPQSD